jgi:hypothetical protein
VPNERAERIDIPITEPWSACASRLIFPAAFSAGGAALRFVPTALGSGPLVGDAAADDCAWFRFAVKVPGGSPLGGYWRFGRPEGVDAARFAALAASVAKAALPALGAECAAFDLFPGAAAAAAPCDAPKFGSAAVFNLDGTVAVGSSRVPLRAYLPPSYPLALASAAAGPSGADAADAFFAASRALAPRLSGAALDALATEFAVDRRPGAPVAGPESVRFIPFHEALGFCSAGDYRVLVQNFLVRDFGGSALAELLYYRRTVEAEGGPKRVLVRPHAFDAAAFAAVLPGPVRDDFVSAVNEGVSSATAEDFIRRNEAVWEAAAHDLRRGALAPTPDIGQLVEAVYVRYAYPRKRRRLDAMIERDFPFAALASLPPRAFRAAVDRSDARTIAAAAVGGSAGLDPVARWCSRGKLRSARYELDRFAALLAEGSADPDELCSLRAAMLKKAKAAAEAEGAERWPVSAPRPAGRSAAAPR